MVIVSLLGVLVSPSFCARQTIAAQDQQRTIRLFQLEGTFGTERPIKLEGYQTAPSAPFRVQTVRLEADPMGGITRLRTIISIANDEPGSRIAEVEWRLDMYDKDLHSLSARLLQSDKVNIYPRETGTVSAKTGAVLPDRMMALFQVTKVVYANSPPWTPQVYCELDKDFDSASCKAR